MILYSDPRYQVTLPKRNWSVAATMYPRTWTVQIPLRTFTVTLTRTWAITQPARTWSI